jgi:hypothetical protein
MARSQKATEMKGIFSPQEGTCDECIRLRKSQSLQGLQGGSGSGRSGVGWLLAGVGWLLKEGS